MLLQRSLGRRVRTNRRLRKSCGRTGTIGAVETPTFLVWPISTWARFLLWDQRSRARLSAWKRATSPEALQMLGLWLLSRTWTREPGLRRRKSAAQHLISALPIRRAESP